MPEKLNAEFVFEKEFTNRHGMQSKTMVILKINYAERKYSVLPHPCTGRNDFRFLNANLTSSTKWNNIIELMKEANEFGTNELSKTNP